MQYLKKIGILAFVISLTLGVSFIPVALAATGNGISQGNQVVIVKDIKSGAVVYKSGPLYYYGFSAPTSSAIISQGEINPNEIIVKYKNESGKVTTQSLDSISNTVGKYGVKITPLNGNLRLAVAKLNQPNNYFTTLHELAKNPNVEYAEPNYIAHIVQAPNDPYYGQQWGPKDIHADLAWDKVDPAKRANVTIAILDTGINFSHEDLQSSIVPGYNFINNDTNPVDGHGHGSHVAGIAAAIVNNGKGIAGIDGGAKIMPVKVMDDSGSGDYTSIINGIKYAADHGAQVISMSLGGDGSSQAMQDAINYAASRGVSVVAASGNNNGPVCFPGNCNGVITVGAVDSSNQRAYFSNYGPEMDVVAPGVNILSSYVGSATAYTSMSGTSMATPFVSGVAGLVKAANPGLSAAQVTNIIDQSAVDLGTPGFDNYYGYGLVDANRAVDLAGGHSGTPSPSPAPTPVPNPTPVPAPVPGVNLALKKPAVASSVEVNTLTADRAFDGNPATRWSSKPGVDPQWIYVDLGKSYQINKIVLKWEVAYGKAYRIYVSNDGNNWSNIYNTSNGSGGTNVLNVTGQGRYVMLYGTGRGTNWGYSLWEFEVYGK
jgi:thermitase